MLIDAHTHLDQYDDATLDAALDEIAVHRMLTVAVSMDPPSYARTQDIAARSPLVLPCFGIHPCIHSAFRCSPRRLRLSAS